MSFKCFYFLETKEYIAFKIETSFAIYNNEVTWERNDLSKSITYFPADLSI